MRGGVGECFIGRGWQRALPACSGFASVPLARPPLSPPLFFFRASSRSPPPGGLSPPPPHTSHGPTRAAPAAPPPPSPAPAGQQRAGHAGLPGDGRRWRRGGRRGRVRHAVLARGAAPVGAVFPRSVCEERMVMECACSLRVRGVGRGEQGPGPRPWPPRGAKALRCAPIRVRRACLFARETAPRFAHAGVLAGGPRARRLRRGRTAWRTGARKPGV